MLGLRVARVQSSLQQLSRVLHCQRTATGVFISWEAVPDALSYRCAYTNKETGDYGYILTTSLQARLPEIASAAYTIRISPLTSRGTYDTKSAYTCTLDAIVQPQQIAPQSTKALSSSARVSADISKLDIRVGRITAISRHPTADNLYVEQVDVGEACSRTIVSGLVPFCTEESLVGSLVTVLCNLKPRNIKGVASAGMLLCSSNSDHTSVEPVRPPSECIVGEVISFPGYVLEPCEPGNRATKAFTKVVSGLRVENGVASFEGVPFTTMHGPCTSTLDGSVS